MINLQPSTLVAYIAGIILVFFICKIFIVPLKIIFKLILNSVLGGIIILIINLVGEAYSFHIGLNIITAVFVGVLGIPGSILLVLIKMLVT